MKSPASFTTIVLPAQKTFAAPDGSEVRLLPELAGGGMAHFRLPPGCIAHAVVHRTVEEIWYVMTGQGRIWRKLGMQEEVTALAPGTALTLPVGTQFQFRNDGTIDLDILGITMPPWPGPDEAIKIDGPWPPGS
jgi:mannose-6-phosphate isomerase-like protein (cupin superfamily)